MIRRVVRLLAVLPVVVPAASVEAQDSELRFRDRLRVTGAVVHRGGPASPGTLYPTELIGNVVGMKADTLLFETGNEPVYWIPLGSGFPLVEKQGTVKASGRAALLGLAIGGAAGVTFGWGFHQECPTDPAIAFSDRCVEERTSGEAALRGLAYGAGIGLGVGWVLGRLATRMSWIRLPLDQIRYVDTPLGGQLSVDLSLGGSAPR